MAIVDTRDGKLDGVQQDGLHAFLGVPFAAPPVGAKRWRAPDFGSGAAADQLARQN